MFKYLKPNNLLKIINKTQKFVFVIFLVIISIGLVEALLLSPEDYKQSDSVRIMYVHVPAAWISLGIFSLIAVLSFGILVFKNKISKKQILYLITGFVGIYFVSFGFSNAFSELNLGALLALLASVSYGFAANIVQPLIKEHGSLKTLKIALRYATIISLVLLVINSGPSIPTYNISLFPMLLLGVGSSGIAFLSFYNLIDDVGAVAGSITVYIIPIFSTIFGFTFLNETTEVIQLVGIFIVIFSAFQFSRIKN